MKAARIGKATCCELKGYINEDRTVRVACPPEFPFARHAMGWEKRRGKDTDPSCKQEAVKED